MPNQYTKQTPHLGQLGSPDTMNESALPRPGELGCAFEYNDRGYQLVQLDSGATASTTLGVVAANQLAFWKDKDTYLVTNDTSQTQLSALSNGHQNCVAGIFRTAVTAGYYCCILQKGDYISVKAEAGGTIGETMIASATTSASVDDVAFGTAATHQRVGIARASVSGGNIYMDVNIDFTPIP